MKKVEIKRVLKPEEPAKVYQSLQVAPVKKKVEVRKVSPNKPQT